MTCAEINEHVRKMRTLSGPDRHRYLQTLIGRPASAPEILDARARLLTALNDADVWPVRYRQMA